MRMARGHVRDPPRGRAVTATANGAAQTRAAEWGEAQFEPAGADVERERAAMRGDGMERSARRVTVAAVALDGALWPATLDEAAAEAAVGYDMDDPDRPMAIVAAQVGLVRGAGPAADAAARRLVLLARAFSEELRGWADAAEEYARDGATVEAAGAAEAGRFVRRPNDRCRFTAMSVDPDLERYRDCQVKIHIRRRAILSPTLVVRYHAFRALLQDDDEEIDSPKEARYADECEVRMPDGARVDPSQMRVVVRRSRLGPGAVSNLGRLRRRGVGVVIDEGL